jgi:hypothetical protein
VFAVFDGHARLIIMQRWDETRVDVLVGLPVAEDNQLKYDLHLQMKRTYVTHIGE